MVGPGAARKVDGRWMQQANRAIVLEIVRTDPTPSRAEIARRTGLSPAALTGIVDHLMAEGLVLEVGPTVGGGVGRRARRLAFNPGARAALGIALDVREVRAALVDLGGSNEAVERSEIPEGATPGEALAVVAETAKRALSASDDRPMIGVGMAIPGMVGWPAGVSLFSPNAGWREVPVRAEMERLLGRAVLVDNEVRALALAEHRYGAARGAGTAVFLDAGYGMGGAVILSGGLYRGVRGAAARSATTRSSRTAPAAPAGTAAAWRSSPPPTACWRGRPPRLPRVRPPPCGESRGRSPSRTCSPRQRAAMRSRRISSGARPRTWAWR